MRGKVFQILRISSGLLLLLLGSLGILFGIIDIIDPVVSKMSDDADPFGVPHTLAESFTLTFIYFLVFLLGIGLVAGLKPLIKLFGKKLQ